MLLVQEGIIVLQGSYLYMRERGIDFDKIIKSYQGQDIFNQTLSVSRESEDFNIYNASDDLSDEEDDDSSHFNDQSEYRNYKIEIRTPDNSGSKNAANKKTAETKGGVGSVKTLQSLFKNSRKYLLL